MMCVWEYLSLESNQQPWAGQHRNYMKFCQKLLLPWWIFVRLAAAVFMEGERLTVISKILKCPFGVFEAIQHRLRLSHEVRMMSKWKTGFLLVFYVCVAKSFSPGWCTGSMVRHNLPLIIKRRQENIGHRWDSNWERNRERQAVNDLRDKSHRVFFCGNTRSFKIDIPVRTLCVLWMWGLRVNNQKFTWLHKHSWQTLQAECCKNRQ